MKTLQKNHERGMSLVEVLASVALLAAAMASSTDILSYGFRLTATANRAASDPLAAGAAAELRRDIQSSTSVLDQQRRWSSEPLVLRTADGQVIYRRDGDRLVRIDRSGGSRPSRDVVPNAVTGWAWRVPAADLVELRVVTAAHRDPTTAASSSDPIGSNTTEPVTWTFAYARRGGAGGDKW